jgi:hypothetical protein
MAQLFKHAATVDYACADVTLLKGTENHKALRAGLFRSSLSFQLIGERDVTTVAA